MSSGHPTQEGDQDRAESESQHLKLPETDEAAMQTRSLAETAARFFYMPTLSVIAETNPKLSIRLPVSCRGGG